MRIYRSVWTVIVTVLSAIAFAAATATTGWLAAVLVAGGMSSVGAMFGALWFEEPEARRRSTVQMALWSGAAGILMLGFTPVIRQGSLVLLLLVAVSAPEVIEWSLRLRATHQRPAALPDLADLTYRALERRWRTTTWQVRSASLTVQDRLQLVIQREWLLEELERRDPARFAGTLVREGWREAQQR